MIPSYPFKCSPEDQASGSLYTVILALSDEHLGGLPRFLFIKPCSTDVAASLRRYVATSLYEVAVACLRQGAAEKTMEPKQPNIWIDSFAPHWSDQRQDKCESKYSKLQGIRTHIPAMHHIRNLRVLNIDSAPSGLHSWHCQSRTNMSMTTSTSPINVICADLMNSTHSKSVKRYCS